MSDASSKPAEKRCGTCKHSQRKFGLTLLYCYADITPEDESRVAAILPWACIKYGITWRADVVAESEGTRCPKWEGVSSKALETCKQPGDCNFPDCPCAVIPVREAKE
jgi:hypothetical protein